MSHFRASILERLEAQTIKYEDGCWLWHGSTTGNGYGVIWFNDKLRLIHRISAYLFLNFDLDSKKLILHKLICPNTNCWNPLHLYIGNQSDNLKDAVILGNQVEARKTHCPAEHPYDEKNTVIDNRGKRICRICQRKASREYQQRRRAKGQVRSNAVKLQLDK